MCGITGFIGQGKKTTLEAMTAAVRHRGPDDSGIYFDEKKGVALGHARLAILDVSEAGHQPMWSDDKTIAIVFNGEIYNFADLRNTLREKFGYEFKSTSDTEVILYAYKAYGEKCFEKMEGMFAIGIYDFSKDRLILARDRAGKKPLYWSFRRGECRNDVSTFTSTRGGTSVFIFASEQKSLVLHPAVERALDLLSLNKYLQMDFVPTPHSIFKDIQKLQPGSYLIYQNNKIEIKKFWQPRFETHHIGMNEAVERLDGMLGEAVKNRLVADVPVGVFLSGGLDSSAIAYYAKKQSISPIKTFSIGFTEKSFDESTYARKVASFLGTDHHEKIFTGEDSLDVIPTVLNSLDEPIADASIIPTFLLSRFAKQFVTVALGGDGGDELFAGYPTFQAQKIARFYSAIPKLMRSKIFEPLVSLMPSQSQNLSLDYKMKKFAAGFDVASLYQHQVWLGSFDRHERSKIFKNDVWQDISSKNEFTDIEAINNEFITGGGKENENGLLYQYEKTYLMDEVLVKVDRATMLASLEARSPLLDYRIIDFVHSLPYSYKLHGFTTKYIFKKLMSEKLPADIVWRKKKGFGMPVAAWFRGPLRDLLEETLSSKNINDMGVFNYAYIEKLKNAHYACVRDNRKQLWNLFVLTLWWKNFLK